MLRPLKRAHRRRLAVQDRPVDPLWIQLPGAAVRGERVLWPAVFDYGDMGANNLIAWDFVKMETELKIRAFAALFGTDRFTLDVVNFEVRLHEATERGRNRDDWPSLPATPTPGDRPASEVLVKQVQEQAREMLEDSTLWQPRLADDHIWIPATYGEASFLGERWEGRSSTIRKPCSSRPGATFMRRACAGRWRC